jgi:hypothetical protein
MRNEYARQPKRISLQMSIYVLNITVSPKSRHAASEHYNWFILGKGEISKTDRD